MRLQKAKRVNEDEALLAHVWAEQKLELIKKFRAQDLKDQQQNRIRREMLYAPRGGIYQRLFITSGKIDWFVGIIDLVTLGKLKILPSQDWVDITKGTLNVSDAAKRFQNPNDLIFARYICFPLLGSNRVELGNRHHLDTVNRYEKNLEQHPITLILIATDPAGDYTVIDGVHHSIAAYLRYFVRSPGSTFIPIIGYLGVCQNESFWNAM